MAKLRPSRREIKKLLETLQKNKSETRNIDAKENLNLKTAGDYALFIRHVAALANTGQVSFLLIGVEDKTWIHKGIPYDSPLQSVDTIQQQMNQALANRLDPRITVCYSTQDIDGLLIGVVGIEGKSPPYIVSIEEPVFGGLKTKGEKSFIYKGSIYSRQGTDNVSVNRQKDLIAILNGKRDSVETAMSLVFIAALVGVGVGLGASLIRFSDPYIAAILGGIWGLMIGWVLNRRLADTMGKFPEGKVGSLTKNLIGPCWGGIMGIYLSFGTINGILTGKIKIYDPVSLGLLIMPIFAGMLAFLAFIAGVIANITYNVIKKS